MSIRERSRFTLLLLATLGMATGCTTLTHHGPWVREGISGDVLSSGSILGNSDGFGSGAILGVDAGLRYGFVPSDSGLPALSVGAQLPLLPFLIAAGEVDESFFNLIAGDIYISGLSGGSTAIAIGISKSIFHTMPYLQIGSREPGEAGWYTTQALMHTSEQLTMWVPSFTWVSASKTKPRATHITIGGAIGTEDGEMRSMFTVGITMEFHRRDARVR